MREDPTAQIAMPKIGRSLPRSLTEAEVESLLAAPAVADPLGHRDRTMLEVLYATGLRVSELVSLKLGQVNLNQGVHARPRQGQPRAADSAGRGSRALAARQFISGARVEILLERRPTTCFPTRRGDRMTRQAFWHIIKRYARKAGVEKRTLAAHAAARVRDASAQSRRRPARRADAARPQRPVDDADLHARRPRAPEGPALAASSARLSGPGRAARARRAMLCLAHATPRFSVRGTGSGQPHGRGSLGGPCRVACTSAQAPAICRRRLQPRLHRP